MQAVTLIKIENIIITIIENIILVFKYVIYHIMIPT